ncbi:heparinase II/III family protein [Psychrobacillus sp. FJAT-51614]|uniref:Heparinase II/III family protein n=1 Tax=Psychrobacillus mangrovi TaxID=3117745 RepID=A0ABU8F0H8_9BACI
MLLDRSLKNIKSNPRILFNEFEIDEIKSRLKQSEFGQVWKDTLKTAESYVIEEKFNVSYPSCSVELDITLPLKQLEPIGDPLGYTDYPFWTMYSRAVEDRIKILSFAFGMTSEKRFAEKVKEFLIALSSFERWFEFPHRGAEGNLSNAHFTIGAAIGYDAIYSFLSEAEKIIIREAILNKGLQPFKIDFNNHDSHNIIASKQVAMLIGSLSIYERVNKDDIEPFLLNSYNYLSNYLDKSMEDPDIEGLLYLNVAARHILMAADILHRSTGDSTLLNHSYFNFLPNVFVYMLGTGGKSSFVNFSDSFYNLDISFTMAILASKTQNRIASWYLNKFSNNQLDTLIHSNNITEPLEPESYYRNKYSNVFFRIGWASLRSGWKDKDHFLAFNSSQSAKDHNHFDQNNFVLHVAGEWLITNPGYQDYVEGSRRDFTIGTVGHNSMLVDGVGQSKMGKSKFINWYTSQNFTYVIGDATNAYDESILKWERKIFHIDKSFYILVDKVMKKNEENIPSFLYHTTSSMYANEKKLIPGEKLEQNFIEFRGEVVSASLYICYPQKTTKTIERYKGAEEYGSYLKVALTENEKSQYLITILAPEILNNEMSYILNSNEPFFEIQINHKSMDIIYFILINEARESAHQITKDRKLSILGEQGWLSFFNGEKTPCTFALTNGCLIMIEEEAFIKSNANINISGSLKRSGINFEIELKTFTQVVIKTPKPKKIKINGEEEHGYDTAYYNNKKGLLELNLHKGDYEVDLDLIK